ncbi:SoxR reducing system RseC family protein [Marinomonas mediterranea]|jgi:positive regulator of sigma(E), RseC/MucC|uniref:Positive regulator of sigma E, RseC/MucC n=1 Tax=Marinomonas mediterranea (strain ATCC 700492 / JCM 21426 / NBRC 103028 / MMB-1) TaxID=717774 RepID=F2K396_MARM1|nr:SoxR reducing system RseC family protein [Marinomonas mediterranea]ADZ90149.1 positive regulator of sigma E, RseC/MucC [Marinomonas mediterranea MMB-1]WCN16353.1 sigma E positive regulator RseC/MucC [Marinomonas mediterranea MMB-1]
MIEENGTVLAVDDGFAEVETIRTSSCETCRARHGCGHHTIAKVTNSNRMQMKAIAPMPVKVGQKVVVGIPEDTLLQASMWMYAIPLLGLMLGATLPSLFTAQTFVSILLACFGFAGGLYLARRKSQQETDNPNFYPKILRIDSSQKRSIEIVQSF